MVSPLFEPTSSDKPTLLTISFADDPGGSLGAQLNNLDKGATEEMFVPAYATIGRLVEGETVARKCGVAVGDVIVAVSGEGFRRFAPDYGDEDALENLTQGMENVTLSDDEKNKKQKVVQGSTGDAYAAMLSRIKEVKKAADPKNPLILSLERYGWDSRVNSWGRFLAARDREVPAAMGMLQEHEQWKTSMFPIDLTSDGLQNILKLKAVSEIDIETPGHYPTVYVNYAKLQQLEGSESPEEVVRAFVIFTEMMLKRAADPRHPKTCQFIDLSGVTVSAGFRVDILKQIYKTFEPNYPETLHKMVMYPVSKTVAMTSKVLLSFVNERTQKKFVITDDLAKVCKELGWDQKEVEECGGVTEFMHKHEKAGDSMIF